MPLMQENYINVAKIMFKVTGYFLNKNNQNKRKKSYKFVCKVTPAKL